MKPFDAALARMRKICLSLPDTKETPTWGQPHFRVGEKIFAGLGEEKGRLAIGFKLERDHADMMVRRPGFWRAPYVGHKGWVSMDAEAVTDWEEVRFLVHESYRLIAPKRTLALWKDEGKAARTPAKPKPARRRRTRAPARKKPAI
jgi:predicted DNA-binding protein (MmcQ/YjbR family)